MNKNYWLDLWTPETWEEASKIGYTVTGFREHRLKGMSRINPGDIFICYLTKISRFCGLLEAASKPYTDDTPIWTSDPFPARIRTNPLVTLQPAYSIPFDNFASRFVSTKAWTGYIRGSPMLLPLQDGQFIERELLNAAKSPREFPLPTRTVLRRGRPKTASILAVTAPLITVPSAETPSPMTNENAEVIKADDIQRILVEMGHGMGLSVWVGRDSRNKTVKGLSFADVCLSSLPQQFDPNTTKIIEYIDVLWLDGNAIVAAFEIEHTTSIYSGLLRMSDLVSMQPNIDIPLYIVAAGDKREKVRQEINRPTFRMLRKPIVDICRFIAYEELISFFNSKKNEFAYIRPTIIRERLAEDCKQSQNYIT